MEQCTGKNYRPQNILLRLIGIIISILNVLKNTVQQIAVKYLTSNSSITHSISSPPAMGIILPRLLVIDGGFGTQLTVHVADIVDDHPLWSARFNHINPTAVTKTHMDFLRNGAEAIAANTYQASVEGYMEHLNLSREESVELIKSTARLAHKAKENYLAECSEKKAKTREGFPLVLASIGSYGAHLHDNSEYGGKYKDDVTPEIIINWHRVRIDACLEAGVDGLAIETIPCQMEAEALVKMLCDEYPDLKFWVSFQCKDETSLAHGQKFSEAALSVWKLLEERDAQNNCWAIGVNCVNPRFVTSLFHSLNGERKDEDKIPLVVYSNSGEIYDTVKGCWTGREHCIPLESYVQEWVQEGAKIIGGCCRTYAEDISRIAQTVADLNIEQM